MNKTMTVLATTIVTAGLITAGLVTGTAGPATAGNVLRLDATTEQFALVDHDGKGPGPGDQLVSSDRLTRAGSTTPIGTDAVTCTVVNVTDTSMTCSWTMVVSLPDGQITLQGLSVGPNRPPTDALTFPLAVTGGTGRYRSASGEAEIVDNPDHTEKITVRLTH